MRADIEGAGTPVLEGLATSGAVADFVCEVLESAFASRFVFEAAAKLGTDAYLIGDAEPELSPRAPLPAAWLSHSLGAATSSPDASLPVRPLSLADCDLNGCRRLRVSGRVLRYRREGVLAPAHLLRVPGDGEWRA